MKIPGGNRHFIFSLTLLIAFCAIVFGPAPKPAAQTRETQQTPPTHKLTITDGPRKTYLKVTMKDIMISSITGTRDRKTFDFKQVKEGEKPKLTGGPNQVLKCVRLIHNSGDYRWTVCFYVDKDGSTAGGPGSEGMDIESFSFGSDLDGGGGGGGGGGSNCWEDQDLQMSICDP